VTPEGRRVPNERHGSGSIMTGRREEGKGKRDSSVFSHNRFGKALTGRILTIPSPDLAERKRAPKKGVAESNSGP